MRLLCAIVLILGLALPAGAQNDRPWSFSASFNGSVNSAGAITKAEPIIGYRFNEHVSTYGGLPVFFVGLSSTETSTGGFMSGIGNAFLGFRGQVDSEVVSFASNLEFTAPTGDQSRGFSTGRMTVDWTNHFSRTFSLVTPFASVGLANTVSDTAFFMRPFSTLGLVGHFEGGATLAFTPAASFSASAYAVRGSGEQRVVSKVVPDLPAAMQAAVPRADGERIRIFETQPEAIVEAEVVNDHGFSTWFAVNVNPVVDFHAGYSRSVSYAYNTLFFGVGFRFGQ
jgi:hypothetical protein